MLLIDFGGHISAQSDELSDAGIVDTAAVGLVNGCDMQLEIAMTRGCSFGAATVQAGDGSFAGESGMKRVIVRPERFRRRKRARAVSFVGPGRAVVSQVVYWKLS